MAAMLEIQALAAGVPSGPRQGNVQMISGPAMTKCIEAHDVEIEFRESVVEFAAPACSKVDSVDPAIRLREVQ